MKKFLRKSKLKLHRAKHKYLDEFVFIHINKTGGSSVEHALNIPFEHKTALEKISELGRARWDKRLTFTVVRNPWDKVVSHYHYRVKTNQTKLQEEPVEVSEWIRRTYGEQDSYYYDNPRMFMPQVNWVSDEGGNILVDHIIHFENLNAEFNAVQKMLGRTATLPHVKPSVRGDYRQYYDQQTMEIVANWFAEDIEKFGYKFQKDSDT